MTTKTYVCKLKEKLLHNESMGESNPSSPTSNHLLGTYSICNEAIDGRTHKYNTLQSPLVKRSRGRPRSTWNQSVVEKVVKNLKLVQQKKTKLQLKKRQPKKQQKKRQK